MIHYRKLFFIIFIFLATHAYLYSQSIPLPDEEAPAAFFSSEIGDSDVDLFITGSWETELKGGYGISWNSEDSEVESYSFPGMVSGLELSHSPDLVISLWLRDRYFFETSFIDDYTMNTFLLGYESPDETFLRSVRIGNTDIGLGSYSYMNIPEASTDSLGGMSLFKSEKSEHQFVLRFDPAEQQTRYFVGKYESDQNRIKPSDYVRGRFYILPDADVDNLVVYIEDSSGTFTDGAGRKYRSADSDDAVISSGEGLVFFRSELVSRAAVSYTKGGSDVGDASLGSSALAGTTGTSGSDRIDLSLAAEDFDWGVTYLGEDMSERQLSIDGNTALLIHEPGEFSPFEMLSVYRVSSLIPEDSTRFRVTLTDRNLLTGDELDIVDDFQDYMFRVLHDGESYRNPSNRYPLADMISEDSSVYGPERLLEGSPADKEILTELLTYSGGYYLDEDVLDGSVSVTINEIPESRFTFDPDTGYVKFLFPVPSNARIAINYRTSSSSGVSGDLIMGLGSRFIFSENLTLQTGIGLRWNILDSEYTEKQDEASGSVIGSAGIRYEGEKIDFSLDAGLSIQNPDTTGIRRLAGMNESGFPVSLSEELLYPAAPAEAPLSGHLTFTADSSTRGILYYRDYHEYSIAGTSVLRDYDWDEYKSYPYADGGLTGPYLAGTDSEIDTDAAVYDYSLLDDEWTGGRIPLSLGSEPYDLSLSRSLDLKWKHIAGFPGTVKVFLRIGKLNEDLDDDGTLDRELSSYGTGFTFNHGSYAMKVGSDTDGTGGNDQLDTEDLDGNGILDKEGPSFTFDTGIELGNSTDWQTLTLNFTPEQRRELTAATSVEVILAADGSGTGGSGKLLIGDISLAGSSFAAAPYSGQNVTVKEVNELYSSSESRSLSDVYPDTSIFAASSGSQKVAEINWEADDGTWDTENGLWEVTSFIEAADLGGYSKITFYMNFPATSTIPDQVTLALTDVSGNGVSFSFEPVASTQWVKYTADYREGSLTADDNEIGINWNSRDTSVDSVNRLILSADVSGEGCMILDEVYLEDTVVNVSGGAKSFFSYSSPGAVLSVKGVPVISNLDFSNESQIISEDFAAGFSNTGDSSIYTNSDLSVLFYTANITGNLDLLWQKRELYQSPGLGISFPLLNKKMTISDSYSEINLPLSESVNRSTSITGNFNSLFLKAETDSVFGSSSLTQSWGFSANLDLEKNTELSGILDLSLARSGFDPYGDSGSLEKFFQSYSLYLPGDMDNDRNTLTSYSFSTDRDRFSAAAEAGLTSSVTGNDNRVLFSRGILKAETGFKFQPEETAESTFTPGYAKILDINSQPSSDTGFFSDAADSFTVLTEQKILALPPVWEIFDPETHSSFKEETSGYYGALYNPSMKFEYVSTSVRGFADLFLPSSAVLEFTRELEREYDSVTDQLDINLDLESSALNLFGKLGSNQIFNWYQTEEISSILSFGAEFETYHDSLFSEPSANLSHSLYIQFFLGSADSIEFETSQTWLWEPYAWNGKASLEYSWEVDPDRDIKIPFMPEETDTDKSYFRHSETITISGDLVSESDESSLTVTAEHNTDLILPGQGEISLFASIGWDRTAADTGDETIYYYIAGIQAGISVKLIF